MSILSRRNVLIGGPVLAVLGAGIILWPEPGLPEGAIALTPEEAHAKVQSGDLWLVDIRRPDEWELTGIGDGAIPLDMRRDDFMEALRAATESDPERPIALICAAGVRSRRMTGRLAEAGFTAIVDVPEGMLGSQAGPGWVNRGLPLVAAPS